jgi:hypothetical protein
VARGGAGRLPRRRSAISGGIFLPDGSETKEVTWVDDHSRFCVIVSVVRRATGRAVCVAFANALREFGVRPGSEYPGGRCTAGGAGPPGHEM